MDGSVNNYREFATANSKSKTATDGGFSLEMGRIELPSECAGQESLQV
jgi:hypothetical protein